MGSKVSLKQTDEPDHQKIRGVLETLVSLWLSAEGIFTMLCLRKELQSKNFDKHLWLLNILFYIYFIISLLKHKFEVYSGQLSRKIFFHVAVKT